MADKPELQHIPRAVGELVLSGARSSLIARARRDAANLMERNPFGEAPSQTVAWLNSAFPDQSNAETQFNIGEAYYYSQDYEQAASWYGKAAGQGHSKAQLSLAVLYEKGQGVEQDHSMATQWLQKAADQGHAIAQLGVGVAYVGGSGVQKDLVKATEWFHEASLQGLAKAQFLLGYAYELGRGVSQDIVKASEWYRMAAEQGETEAQTRLGLLDRRSRGVRQSDSDA